MDTCKYSDTDTNYYERQFIGFYLIYTYRPSGHEGILTLKKDKESDEDGKNKLEMYLWKCYALALKDILKQKTALLPEQGGATKQLIK